MTGLEVVCASVTTERVVRTESAAMKNSLRVIMRVLAGENSLWSRTVTGFILKTYSQTGLLAAMKRSLLIYFFVVIVVQALSSVANASQVSKCVYDLNANWSDDKNPNGVWSYNLGDSQISTHQTFWWGQAGWGYMWIGDGCIIKGNYFQGATDPWGNVAGPAHDWKPGDVMMHALSIPYGGESTFLNVKWTSPADGLIDISGRVWDGTIAPDRDVAWQLIVGGKVIAQRSSVIGIFREEKRAQFSSNVVKKNSLKNIWVKAGDVVELRTITKTYYGHFVGVQETITLTSRRK